MELMRANLAKNIQLTYSGILILNYTFCRMLDDKKQPL